MEFERQYHSCTENRYHRPPVIPHPADDTGAEPDRSMTRRIQVRWRRNVLTAVRVVLLPSR